MSTLMGSTTHMPTCPVRKTYTRPQLCIINTNRHALTYANETPPYPPSFENKIHICYPFARDGRSCTYPAMYDVCPANLLPVFSAARILSRYLKLKGGCKAQLLQRKEAFRSPYASELYLRGYVQGLTL